MERKPTQGNANVRRSAPAQRRPSGSAVRNNPSQSGYNRRPQGANTRYGNPRPQNNPQTPNIRRAPARKKSPYRLVPVVLLLGVLALVIYIISCGAVAGANRRTFCDNIFVNGFELTDYTLEEARTTIQEQIDGRIDSVYTLTCEGKSWDFRPSDVGATIEVEDYLTRAWNIGHTGSIFQKRSQIAQLKDVPVVFTAPLVYDEALINQLIDRIYNDVYVPATDAEIAIAADRPYILSNSSTGVELDRDAAREQIIALVETGSGNTALPAKVVQPAVSSDMAQGGLEVIVEVVTDVSFRDYNSRFNVRKGLGYFNGMCVYPGDTIDFNEIVGPRTEERGWRSGGEFVGGQTVKGWGGGICQASTTLYDAVLKAGMTIVKRSNHTMRVSYVDPSMDAAVSDAGGDTLIFENATNHAIYIYTEVTGETATVRIYGNRPDYRYELESVVISEDSECSKKRYVPDENGNHCYYTDEVKIKTRGLPAMTSEGWLVSYDWTTGEEVARKLLSRDSYASGTDVYYQGTHARAV
ncbi:MAG: VanW family protein [Clostridia bacterium]|nr:VanW family protein [Clostridia bacterium]